MTIAYKRENHHQIPVLGNINPLNFYFFYGIDASLICQVAIRSYGSWKDFETLVKQVSILRGSFW